jgi:microcystin-dependent protein
MFLSNLKRVAEGVGLACFVLLAGLGLLSMVRGGAATAAGLAPGAAAVPASFAQEPLAVTSGSATVPLVMNYQGTLRDTEGTLLDGTYGLTFRIYDAVDDAVADALWTEVHAGVVVRDGLFNVVLGDITAISPTLFDSPNRFVGVQVGDDDELVPRQRFASVPYALRADVPAGTIVAFGGSTPPAGWLLCNGAALGTTAYPELFGAIAYVWGGSGDTFNVPDLRGRAPIGSGQGNGLTNRTLAQTGGEERHQLTIAEMPNHNHTVDSVPNYDSNFGWMQANSFGNPETLQTSYTGGDQAHNNMQPFAVVNFIIKY